MSTATVKRAKKAHVSEATLEAIFTEHKIPAFYWEELKALIHYGDRPQADLVHRLNHVGNYKACMKAILTVLSEAYYKESGIRFPPPGWQPGMPRKAA